MTNATLSTTDRHKCRPTRCWREGRRQERIEPFIEFWQLSNHLFTMQSHSQSASVAFVSNSCRVMRREFSSINILLKGPIHLHSTERLQPMKISSELTFIHSFAIARKIMEIIVSAAQRNKMEPIERTHSTVIIVDECLQTATYDSCMADEWLPIPLFSYSRLKHFVLFVIWWSAALGIICSNLSAFLVQTKQLFVWMSVPGWWLCSCAPEHVLWIESDCRNNSNLVEIFESFHTDARHQKWITRHRPKRAISATPLRKTPLNLAKCCTTKKSTLTHIVW